MPLIFILIYNLVNIIFKTLRFINKNVNEIFSLNTLNIFNKLSQNACMRTLAVP